MGGEKDPDNSSGGSGGESVTGSITISRTSYENYYVVTGIGDYTGSTITIPNTYNDLPVKRIENEAFKGKKHHKVIVSYMSC